MNRKLRGLILRMMTVMMLAAAISFQSFAASGKITFTDPSAQVGEEVSVTMRFVCSTGEVLGNTDVMLAYDPNVLEFIDDLDNVNGGAGAIRVTSAETGATEYTVRLKFKALQAGSSQITVTSCEAYDNADQALTMEHQGSSTITIGASAAASADAALSSLQISPGTLSPEFSPEVENYTTTVSLDTQRLTVSAVPASAAASVAVEGGTELQDGENTVTCRVTAEDGTTVRNYTIVVTRAEGGETAAETAAEESQEPSAEVLAELEAGRTPLKIGVMDFPADAQIPSNLKESTISIGGTKVTGWTPITEGTAEYCIFYGVNEEGTAGYYRYDMIEKTIQRYFLEDMSNEQKTQLEEVAAQYNALVDDYGRLRWIAIGAAVLAVLLLLALIIVAASKKGKGSAEPERGSRRAEPETAAAKPAGKSASRARSGKKISKEELYMMGEEDEYTEDEEEDLSAYMPEALPKEESVPVEESELIVEPEIHVALDPQPEILLSDEAIEEEIAQKLAKEAAAAVAPEPEEEDDDDFEVFDLDEEK